eukprot:749273-Hanusia_phi.AAC.1
MQTQAVLSKVRTSDGEAYGEEAKRGKLEEEQACCGQGQGVEKEKGRVDNRGGGSAQHDEMEQEEKESKSWKKGEQGEQGRKQRRRGRRKGGKERAGAAGKPRSGGGAAMKIRN